MSTLRDLVEDCADREGVAIGAPEAGEQVYTYERLATTTYSLAAALAERGVDEDSLVALTPAEAPETVVGLLATTILGARARFSGPARAPVDALIGPVDAVGKYEIPEGAARIGFGSRPDSAAISHFGKLVWKAADTPPDAPVLPTTRALSDGEYVYSHRALLRAGQAVIEARDLTPDMTVVVRSALTDPRTVAAGLIAPLMAGSTIRFPIDGRSHGDLAITEDDAPERRLLLVFDVPLGD